MGEGTRHVMKNHNQLGVIYHITENNILLFYKELIINFSCPYQDAYGEVSPFLAVTKMELNEMKNNYLQDIWQNNSIIDEINHKRLSADRYIISNYY